MRESESAVDRIKRNIHRVDKLVAEKKFTIKVIKAKQGIVLSSNQYLINDL